MYFLERNRSWKRCMTSFRLRRLSFSGLWSLTCTEWKYKFPLYIKISSPLIKRVSSRNENGPAATRRKVISICHSVRNFIHLSILRSWKIFNSWSSMYDKTCNFKHRLCDGLHLTERRWWNGPKNSHKKGRQILEGNRCFLGLPRNQEVWAEGPL